MPRAHLEPHGSKRLRDIPLNNRAVRILVFPYGPSNGFVGRLCGALKRLEPRFTFDACDSLDSETPGSVVRKEGFAAIVRRPRRRVDLLTGSVAARAFFSGVLFKRLVLGLRYGSCNVEALVAQASSALQTCAVRRELQRHGPYDVYHLQYCTPDRLKYVDAVPRRAMVVCSFWGTDLLRQSGVYAYAAQAAMLERATAVTVQSVELGEVLLAKFGRSLRDKLHFCRFPIDTGVFAAIERLEAFPSDLLSLRAALGIESKRLAVGVGNNGHPANQHLDVVRLLARLPATVKKRFTLVFPMTYGQRDEHVSAVKEACAGAAIDCVVITRFLSLSELAALRMSLDMFLYVPISDALSGTVLEAIYAGSKVVAGAWLPYGVYRRLGLGFEEVESTSVLPATVARCVAAERPPRTVDREARSRIRTLVNLERVSAEWARMYEHILGGRQQSPELLI